MKLPSKTFILGEYVVLDGGPSLILTSAPHFEINIQAIPKDEKQTNHPFHLESPAGKWAVQQGDFFKHHLIKFFDPHEGRGGFGASSAQFIGVYSAINPIQRNLSSIKALLEAYWTMFPADTQTLPSGADLVAQVWGDIVYWHRARQLLVSYHWPFKDLHFCLIHTGQKISTHEHLDHLPTAHALTQMADVVEEGMKAFTAHNERYFVEAIQRYARLMQQEKCVTPTTQKLLESLYQSNLIAAAKGCGALGADVILLVTPPEKMKALVNWLQQRDIKIVHD